MPAASRRYSLAIGDTATVANLARTVSPADPAAQLSVGPPRQDVQVLLIVDELGKVNEARIVDEAQAGQRRRAFNLATPTAVIQWRFNPLQIQHEGHDANGNLVVDSAARPFSLTDDFCFGCGGGKVTMTSHKGARSQS